MPRKERESYWRNLIEQQSASSLSIAAFCRKNNINQWGFYRWRRRLDGQDHRAFVRLKVPAPIVNPSNGRLRIRVNDTLSIEIEQGFDPSTLRAVLDVLCE